MSAPNFTEGVENTLTPASAVPGEKAQCFQG